jgi:intracellular sulfur oxidation DsrE/DsrF family protein
MNRKIRFLTMVFVCLMVSLSGVWTAKSAFAKPDSPLQIDIPVKLEKANVVMDVGHLVMSSGDMPFLLGDLNLLATDYKKWGTSGNIVAVFHGDAAYLVLNDAAYNLDRHIVNDESYNAGRHVKSGNPYAELIGELMKKGVQIELCGATAAANHWGNADLLPGVKVNTNAMVRVTQLEQQGYTLIYE